MSTFKALPLDGSHDDVSRLRVQPAPLAGFPTPQVTLSDAALHHNVGTMARWTAEHGVGLAPHGKTTMSRELWQRQLDAGAWGITVATPWQLATALDWGVPRVMHANSFVQPGAIRAVGARAHEHEIVVWADSLRAVEIMNENLAGAEGEGRIGVLVELGQQGGRTGARSHEAALDIARAVEASPRLRLAGVAGYEGALAHTSEDESLAIVRDYLQRVVALHTAIAEQGLYPEGRVIVTAGGSAYFDLVVEVLAPLAAAGVEVLLRSGAYITHDDGFYRYIDPLGRADGGSFQAAIHGWATVTSRPEPGLVLVDGGRRDFPADEGLPEPQAIRRYGADLIEPFEGAEATAINDQHLFVRVPEHSDIQVGDVLRFGLSHPCTTFDKWQALVLVDDATAARPNVIGLVETAFG